MNPTVESREGVAWVGGKPRTYKRGMSQKEYTPFVKHFAEGNEGLTTAHFLSDYVNHNETRAALNIPDEVQAWYAETNSEFTYHFQQEASMWIYPILKGRGLDRCSIPETLMERLISLAFSLAIFLSLE